MSRCDGHGSIARILSHMYLFYLALIHMKPLLHTDGLYNFSFYQNKKRRLRSVTPRSAQVSGLQIVMR